MLALPYKIEKDKQVNPKRIHKMPKNSRHREAKVIRRSVFMRCVFIHYPEQHDDPCKNM